MSVLTQAKEAEVLHPFDVEEAMQAEAEHWCTAYECLVQELEIREPTDEDFRRLAAHEINCLTGRHSDPAVAEALDLPREALRQGSLEHGLQTPEVLMALSLSTLELWQSSATDSGNTSRTAPASVEVNALIERQYDLARQYPGEYVVLRGTKVIGHSRSRSDAFATYDRAFDGTSDAHPVIVEPHRAYDEEPVVRGRSLAEDSHPR